MKQQPIIIYLASNGYAFSNVLQKISDIPRLNINEQTWTLFGALLVELDKLNIRDILVYNDSRFVEEYNEKVEFISPTAKNIAKNIHNEFKKKFIKIVVEKTDSAAIQAKLCKI